MATLALLLVAIGWGNALVWESYSLALWDPHAQRRRGLIAAASDAAGPLIANVIGGVTWAGVAWQLAASTILMLRNQTSWEYLRRRRIPYLRGVDGNPFDGGAARNLRDFCGRRATWALPPDHPLRGDAFA